MQPPSPGANRNPQERAAADNLSQIFLDNPDSIGAKLDQFPKYARLQSMSRFLMRYELFRRILEVKGSIVECGVYQGAGVMTWANLSAILEPANFQRRVYGFDTFAGFPVDRAPEDAGLQPVGGECLVADSRSELEQILGAFDANRYLGHIPKVELIAGDACQTIPKFIETHPHVVIALLFLDFDLYEPTLAALKHLLPRMPKGAILAFDELDHPAWPGETLAALEEVGLNKLELKRFVFDPYASYVVIS